MALLSQVATVGVTCDNELAKSMRTDDPRRDSVAASVREQVAFVKEIAKATLAEISELSRPKVAERVFDLLRGVQISSVSQLQEHIKKCTAMTKIVEEACGILHCHDSEVSMRAKGLSTALSVERQTSDELRLQLIQKDLQIEQLRQEVEELGQRKANAPMDHDNSAEAAQGESNSMRQHDSMEKQHRHSSRIWTPSHQQCYETMRRGDFEQCHEMRQSSATGEAIEFSLGDYIRTMSLPEVQPFSGRPGECFKRFVNSFDMKYPKEKWRDSNRVQLFQSFLRKNALTVFETLPREIREGTYDGVIEAMKARMRIDGNSQRVKALANLRLLALKPGQPLSEFCFALEGLANRAYPDMPPEATSYCLTEALETSKCEEAYEKVKEAALRLERSLKTAEECRRLDQRRSEIRHGQLTFRRGEPIDDRSPKSSPRSDPEKASKPTIGHRPQTAPNFQKKNGRMVHQAKDCRDRLGRQQSTPSTVSAQQRPNAAYASLVEKWVCTSFRVPESETSELFGDKPAGIMLCGIEATGAIRYRLPNDHHSGETVKESDR
ncbi:hypothetical protein OSTOST_03451, partial [Ostertagia ostertagi]